MARNLWLEALVSLFRPNPPLKARETVYEKLELPPSRAKFYVVVGAAAAVLALALAFFSGLEALAFFAATAAPPLLFMAWVIRTDRYEPEPKYLITLTYGLGVFAGIVAWWSVSSIPLGPAYPFARGFAEAVVLFIVLYFLASGPFEKEFNDHMDGLVYGAAAGLGVVTVYNYLYLRLSIGGGASLLYTVPAEAFVTEALLNTVIVVLAAIMGRWMGWVEVAEGRVTPKNALPGLLPYLLLRWVYSVSETTGLKIGFVPAVPPLLLIAYFLITWKLAREAIRDEVAWGYAEGKAPVEKGGGS